MTGFWHYSDDYLLYSSLIDEWSLRYAGLKSITNYKFVNGLRQLLTEFIIDAILYKHPIGRHTSLQGRKYLNNKG